jgi:predicted DNA-binding WGR domain protein
MRIYLQTPPAADLPPRYCHLILQEDLIEGWSLIRETGAQGRAGRIKQQHFPDRNLAEVALIAARDEQVKRGYQVVYIEGHLPR